MKADDVLAAIIAFPFALLLFIGLSALLSLPTMWVLNYVLSQQALVFFFGGPLVFLKAWGLNFVCGLLFRRSGISGKKT